MKLTPEKRSEIGRLGGLTTQARHPDQSAANGRLSCHRRWHVKRNAPPKRFCALCTLERHAEILALMAALAPTFDARQFELQ